MFKPSRTNRAGAWLLAAATACGPWARSAPPEIAGIRTEVEAAVAPGKMPAGFAARAEVVRRLVALHDRLVGDPRFATSPDLRFLRGRVAARLAHLRGRLERDLAATESTAARKSRGPRAAGGQAADARQLIDLIQATVRPESWDVAGGTGSIRYFDNGHGLVVSATEDVHQELGDLLRQLR